MNINFKFIVKTIEEVRDIPTGSLLTDSKNRGIAVSRLIAMYICRVLGGMTYTEIGNIFNRDYSTIIRGCVRIKTLMKNPDFLKEYNKILKTIFHKAKGS